MARDHHLTTTTATTTIISCSNFYYLCFSFYTFSMLSLISFIFWSQSSSPSPRPCMESLLTTITTDHNRNHKQSFNLLDFPSALNQLTFSSKPPPKLLKIALFVKRWPARNLAGGLERHALTLHLALARRGHEVHVFTTNHSSSIVSSYNDANTLKFHLTPPSPAGYLNQALAWQQFSVENTTVKPFDVIHTESVGLSHGRARNITNLAASWHGIAYETIHSDIVQDLLRGPEEPRQTIITERLSKVIEEVKFFRAYTHHVATSDHVGDVLKRIYMIPEERVHIIVNGVDENVFRPDSKARKEYRMKVGVPENAGLVIGIAGRLVRDKGHPMMYEALKQVFDEDDRFRTSAYVLVAGNGPWGSRYQELGPNIIVLGPLEQKEIAQFYNSLDVFLNPTLRAQGLDHTLIEAMLCGVSVMATRFASITGSLIVGPEIGYTFHPTVDSLKKSLYKIMNDGNQALMAKGAVARQRASLLFTTTKMAAAYESLFLCIAKGVDMKQFCNYPLP